MPLGRRLARVLPPKQKPWQHSFAAFVSRPTREAAAAGIGTPWLNRRHTESRRTLANASTPRRQRDSDGASQSRRQQDSRRPQAKPSIFEELFPDEARVTRERVPQDKERAGTAPPRDADAVPEEVRQWLKSESEAEGAHAHGGQAQASEGSGNAATDSAGRPTAPDVAWKTKAQQRKTKPTVLVLSGTTASLLPSDFFRIAPRVSASQPADTAAALGDQDVVAASRLVEGWAAGNGGIYKIVQDRDPATLTPRGRYFLYFGSSAAALAYSQEVRDLHMLARRAVQPPQRGKASARRRQKRQQEDQVVAGGVHGGGAFSDLAGNISSGGSGAGSDAYLVSSATEDEVAALRSFSLLPPTAQLDLVLQMPAGSGKDGNPSSSSSSSSLTLYDEEELDDVAAIDATTKVLVVLEDTSASGGGNGGGGGGYSDSNNPGVTTVEGLRSLIEEDGVRRNLPWAVSDGLNGVVPVRWLVAEQKRLLHEAVQATSGRTAAKSKRTEKEGDDGSNKNSHSTTRLPLSSPPIALWASRVPDLLAKTDQMNEHARFARFVVAFADAVEARRFVRSWHRRAVTVPGTGAAAPYEQTAIVDTTVLW